MCIAFPGLVVEVDAFGAVVETEGRRRRASTLFLPDIAVGDWVAVAAGTIVERLEPERAADIQDLLRSAIALEEADQVAGVYPVPDASMPDAATERPAARAAPATRSPGEGAPDVHAS